MRWVLEMIELIIGVALGAVCSWFIARYYYLESKRGSVETYTATQIVNCTIEEAWRRITNPANIGNLAWSGPTFPVGATLSVGTEINYAPHGDGGLHVIEVDAPNLISFGDSSDSWDKAIRINSRVTGTQVSYLRRLHHRGNRDRGEENAQGIVDWDLQRLMVCFNDLDRV